MPTPICQVSRLGVMEYCQAWELQRTLAQEVHGGHRPNTLLLVEHPPVYTIGRLSRPAHVLLSAEQLARRGIAVCETDRGGQVTFHGPGQLVAYPVVNLRDWGGPVKYVRTLEQVIIRTLADFNLQGGLVEGLTGVWIGDAKIAAIGVKISRGVAFHGFALNVNTDLSYFDYIVPCGIAGRSVTSMSALLGQEVELEMAQYSVVYHFGTAMGFRMVED